MNINTKKLKLLLLSAALPLSLGISAAQAGPTFNFEGSNAGGTGSATMEFSDASVTFGNTLSVFLDNTSPTTLDGGTGVNTPGIVGFGFNSEDPVPNIETWRLDAFTIGGAPIQIGGSTPNPGSGTGDWVMSTTLAGMTLDYLPQTAGAVQGALYNPLATQGFGAEPNYFTQAILTMTFDGNFNLDAFTGNGTCTRTDPCSPFVRFQNVGLNGAGSLRLPGVPDNGEEPPAQIPEPAPLALLSLGLLAMGWVSYRRRGA